MAVNMWTRVYVSVVRRCSPLGSSVGFQASNTESFQACRSCSLLRRKAFQPRKFRDRFVKMLAYANKQSAQNTAGEETLR